MAESRARSQGVLTAGWAAGWALTGWGDCGLRVTRAGGARGLEGWRAGGSPFEQRRAAGGAPGWGRLSSAESLLGTPASSLSFLGLSKEKEQKERGEPAKEETCRLLSESWRAAAQPRGDALYSTACFAIGGLGSWLLNTFASRHSLYSYRLGVLQQCE